MISVFEGLSLSRTIRFPTEMNTFGSRDKHIYIYIHIIHIYMGGCPKVFLLQTAILSQKKFTLAKLSPFPQKNFAGPFVGLYLGIFGRKQELDKGHLRV